MTGPRILLALLASALVAGCSGGIGGTGSRADGGIGGTGAPAADLALFGVVTGFGSIFVDGVEVHYDRATPLELNGAPQLALGQTVLVQARSLEPMRGAPQARATSIRVADALVGTVAAGDGAGIVRVDGRRVRIDAGTVLGPGTGAAPKSGETLRVSGFATADGTIAATRIERAPAGKSAQREQLSAADLKSGHFIVEGYVTGISRDEVRVGTVALTADAPLGSMARDQLVRVSGRNENGRLVVERAERLSGVLPPRGERPGARPGSGDRGERGERGERGGPDDRPDNSGRGSVDRPDRPEIGRASCRERV